MNKFAVQPAVVILAAGISERMGKPKHKLVFSGEETFLDHIIRVYRRYGVSEILLVIGESAGWKSFRPDKPIKTVINRNPEYGRFHSIRLGLKELKNIPVFIQNIDNPFVNAGVLVSLKNGLGEEEFAVPVYEGRSGHPVLLSDKIIKSVINDFQSNDRFDEVLKSFKRKDVIVNDPYIGVNINTPEDYKRYFSRQ